MSRILWLVFAILWMSFLGQQARAQADAEENAPSTSLTVPLGPCQHFIAQAWRYGGRGQDNATADDDTLPSRQALLQDQVQAICHLNGEQPRTDDGAIATDQEPSPENFTIPSLWWPQQQLGDAINERLIESWRAYAQSTSVADQNYPLNPNNISHVDVVINGQLWPSLNYLERYSLMSQFGQSAKDYGYQLRVFTGNRPVGLQVCDFHGDIVSPIPLDNPTEPGMIKPTPICAMVLNYFDQGAIRGRQR